MEIIPSEVQKVKDFFDEHEISATIDRPFNDDGIWWVDVSNERSGHDNISIIWSKERSYGIYEESSDPLHGMFSGPDKVYTDYETLIASIKSQGHMKRLIERNLKLREEMPHIIKLPKNYRTHSELSNTELDILISDEVHWFADNIKKSYHIGIYQVYFENEDDALLYKLTWC